MLLLPTNLIVRFGSGTRLLSRGLTLQVSWCSACRSQEKLTRDAAGQASCCARGKDVLGR